MSPKLASGPRVSIRPERVEFSKDRMEPGAHTLTAEVLEFIYMGDMFRTRLRVAGNDNFIVKTRNAPDQVQSGAWRPRLKSVGCLPIAEL